MTGHSGFGRVQGLRVQCSHSRSLKQQGVLEIQLVGDRRWVCIFVEFNRFRWSSGFTEGLVYPVSRLCQGCGGFTLWGPSCKAVE